MGRKRLSGSEMSTFEHWREGGRGDLTKGGASVSYVLYLQYMPLAGKPGGVFLATWTFEVGAPKCGSCGDVFKLGRRSCFVGGWDEEGLYEWRGGGMCGYGGLGKGDVVGGLWGLLFLFEIWRVWLGWRVRDLGGVVSCGLCQQ